MVVLLEVVAVKVVVAAESVAPRCCDPAARSCTRAACTAPSIQTCGGMSVNGVCERGFRQSFTFEFKNERGFVETLTPLSHTPHPHHQPFTKPDCGYVWMCAVHDPES